MGDTEKGNIDLLRNLQTHANHQLLGANNLDASQLNLAQIQGPARQNLQNFFNFGPENGARMAGFAPSYPQMPPLPPYTQMPVNRSTGHPMGLQSPGLTPCHSRSLSQPPAFNFDSLPPIAPSPHKNVSTSPGSGERSENRDVAGGGISPVVANKEGLPPRKLHRRSMSDVPFGLNNGQLQSPPLPPIGPQGGRGGLQRALSGGQNDSFAKPTQLFKKETEKKLDGEIMDDFITAYMNLESFDLSNSGGTNENREEMDSRTSNSKTKGSDNSDNDADSSVNDSGCSGQVGMGNASTGNRKEGLKRSAGSDIAPTTRHQRSISMDSFMGKLQLNDDSPNLLPSAAGALAGQVSAGGHSRGLGSESRQCMFSGEEIEKIVSNEKLAEIAVNDPKRVKRILANRQSAARSKERKVRYISELEHKVQALQNEATTLSAQLTMLQNDSERLTTMNTELKLRLLAFEQHAQLRDALNDTLTKEIQRLKIVTGELVDPRTICPNPIGFPNCQMLQQQLLPATPAQEPQQEPSSSSFKSESNSSRE